MTLATEPAARQQLSLPEELILMLLNEESGYFYQVPGWNLNCAMVGAALAELSLIGRIDTDMESLILLDSTPTGDPLLDPILSEIAGESESHNARHWIERLVPQSGEILSTGMDELVERGVLEHHDGEFWTISHFALHSTVDRDGQRLEFVKTRVRRIIFAEELPDPRDVIIIALANTCDVLRLMFELNEPFPARIEFISRMDLIGRSIGEAVSEALAAPGLQRPSFTREIATASLPRLIFNRHLREGNVPALFADLAERYGPVFRLAPPFQEPMIVMTGLEVNRWAQREGRQFLTSKRYLEGLEDLYGAHGIIPALDSADHFRMRKAMQPGLSRAQLVSQLDSLYQQLRAHMAEWQVGEPLPAKSFARLMTNAQISPLLNSVESQDIIEDVIEYKERALNTHVARVLPRFLMRTPGIRRKGKSVEELISRVEVNHTPAQRAGCPHDLVDDLLSVHSNDPQLLPESSLKFALSAPLLASMYLGDLLGFAIFLMASQPELYERIQAEADAIFADGDPDPDLFRGPATDVTRRFVLECLRMYPVVPGSVRHVMNSCVVEGYELPLSARVFIAQTATHYMDDVFPDPHRFDIDRYLPGRDEHHSVGYAPFGLGTHTCLGGHWVELQAAVDLLLIAHYFDIEVHPRGAKPKVSPLPSMSLSNKTKFVITKKRREIPV